jgi:hypothetical protein
MLSRHSLAWILSLGLSAGSPEKGVVLPYSVFLVLRAAPPTRAVALNSYLRLCEYGSAVLVSGLWRPVLILEFPRLLRKSLALVPRFFHMCLLI